MENNTSDPNPNNVSSGEVTEDSENLEKLTKNGMQSLMELIKASNNLPIDQWDFFKTFPAFNGLIMPESQKILELLNSVLQHQQIRGNIIRRDDDEKYEMVIETNDAILERVDCNLDELQGLKKNPEPVVGEVRAVNRRGVFSLNNRVSHNADHQTGIVRSLVTTRLNIRPQIKFKDKIDNRNIPFEPRIKEKPNALKPLAILVEKYDDRGESFSHPYEYELDMFKPPEDQLQLCSPQKPKPLDEIPLVFVKDLDTLNSMMEHLKKNREIAVDVEYHSYRSFQGFTCLVQISTREMDYIVDALELRHELHVLNEVFTDPKIVKVLHGAEHDIEWLQKDLCVYIVNLFDTHQAAQLLEFPRLSLAYLLKVFCNVDSNKQFQLYDWRTRPLSEDAIKYAREDTHYLLYLYDKLKNTLIEKCQNKSNLLEIVLNRSTEICKRKYWKDILTDDSHMEFYRRSKKMFDNKQMYALKHLYQWRDKVAREEDESIMYVLPNHMLLNIAENLPREVQGISALCNPVPPLVKLHEREIHKIILKAREQSLVKPVVEGDSILNQSLEMQPNWVPVNIDSKLYCPHDLSHCDEDFRENLPTLLQRNLKAPTSLDVKNNKFVMEESAIIDVLTDGCQSEDPEQTDGILKTKERQWKFVSPYQRYQKVIAFVQAEETKVSEEKSESKNGNDKANSDGPSPAKRPKVVGSEESMGDTNKDANGRGDVIKSDVNGAGTSTSIESQVNSLQECDSNSRLAACSVSSGSSAVIESALITNSSDNSNSSNISKKKKKKKKKDDTCPEELPSSNKEFDRAGKSQPVVSNSNEGNAVGNPVTAEIGEEVVIPNILEEGEIIDDEETVSPSSTCINQQKSNNKKRKAAKKNGAEKRKSTKDDSGGDKESRDVVDKKRIKTKDDFQPFNYSAVDFSRFQSNTSDKNSKNTPVSNKKQQGRRTPWLGNKKNIRKTISSLKK